MEKDIIALAFALLICITIFFGFSEFSARRQLAAARDKLESVTGELLTAENTNRELTEQLSAERALIETARGTISDLSEAVESSGATIADSIRLIKIVRVQVKELEDCLLARDSYSDSDQRDSHMASK